MRKKGLLLAAFFFFLSAGLLVHAERGFRLAGIEPYEGSAGIDMIRIANAGTQSLFVDAVIGYSRRVEERRQ